MIPALDKVLRKAIREQRLIRIVYAERERVAEPHDYGLQGGDPRLLAYQLEPPAGWRLFAVARMSECVVLDETFPGGRPTSTGKHQRWDRLFARVRPAKFARVRPAK